MNNPMTHNSAVRKIHNLLSSGAVTVTGPNQPRILKQKVGSTTVTPTNSVVQQQQQQQVNTGNRCYVCDDGLNAGQAQHSLTEMSTSHTATKFPNKIGQLVGDAFMVIVSVEDVLCSRCTNLINYLDRLENDVERVRTNLMSLLHKKYGLNDEGGGGGTASPPIKMQKLNSGGQATTRTDDGSDLGRTRKLLHTPDSTLGKQSPPVSAVQQIKISTQPLQTTQQQQQLQQTSLAAGTQTTTTVQRKTTRIYKCLSCDYKTSDMRLFNTHYETCKHQNFQCKNCKKIFPNFGAMKQHMVREHNTPMDNTCAVCHINFVNESSLRKHMEMNHSTSVVVTSTTTLPATAVVAATAPEPIAAPPPPTPLYTCTHCQFKSSDKNVFDEHLRKHLPGGAPKPKPFKCRLCAQRFETREAATVHAKQHQPNYFKCGTCSMSFPKRELLVKHFEVHQQPAAPVAPVTIAPAKQSIVPAQNLLTTQKLLQDTIDEALSDTVTTTVTTANVAAAATDTGGANNIRFFSCHVCSLTFIQENYYNQHMETHRRETSKTERVVAVTSAAGNAAVTLHSNNSGSSSLTSTVALLNDPLAGAQSVGVGSRQQQQRDSSQLAHANVNTLAAAASISEADIESIFEKMHSDKSDTSGNDSTLIAASTSAAHTATTNTTTAAVGGQDNLVITSQEGSGGITFNITIPQQDQQQQASKITPTSSAPVTMSIDMPMLDQPDEPASIAKHDENSAKSESGVRTSAVPVSMPSLDDDNETQEEEQQAQPSAVDVASTEIHIAAEKQEENAAASESETKTEEQHMAEAAAAQEATVAEHENAEAVSAAGGGEMDEEAAALHEQQQQQLAAEAAEGGDQQQQQHVAMELDEAMQAQVESGQIKFILNENGQLLQLNDHIITDADGNQILVQDPEQIQQLLQSVGVLQSGDGLDGETLQMMTDANGQMVLVQGENNETQLIDASLLNADGQLVIQQGQDGELGEGAHVIGEDGTRIPVSVSYTADGQPIVQVQQQHVMQAEATSDAGGEDTQHLSTEKDASGGGAGESSGIVEDETNQQQQQQHEVADAAGVVGADGGDVGGGDATAPASSGGFFALEELMQQSQQHTEAEAAKSTTAAE